MIVHFQDPEKHILDNFCAFFEQKIMEIHRILGASVHTIAELYFTIEFIFSNIVIKYNCPISMVFLKKSTRSCTEMYFVESKSMANEHEIRVFSTDLDVPLHK